MRKIILITAIVGLSMGAAFAQPSPPQGGANQSPTSPTNSMDKDGMKKDNMGSTSCMSKDTMSKDGMKNDMQGGASKDGTGQMKRRHV